MVAEFGRMNGHEGCKVGWSLCEFTTLSLMPVEWHATRIGRENAVTPLGYSSMVISTLEAVVFACALGVADIRD